MANLLLPPLNSQVEIVDDKGRPTTQFTRLLQKLSVSSGFSVTNGKIDFAAIAAKTILANKTASSASPTACTISDILDFVSSTRGSVLFRGATGWQALPPDTAGKVLQTNGAGADPTWVTPAAGGAGALTFIQRITIGTAGDPISFTPIAGTYKDLVIEARLRGNEASAVINAYIRFNNDNTANYDYMGMQSTSTLVQNFNGLAQSTSFCGAVPSGGATAGYFSSHDMRVPLYANTTMEKHYASLNYAKGTNATGNMFNQNVAGSWRSTAAITRVDLVPSAGTGWAVGSVVDLYGRG